MTLKQSTTQAFFFQIQNGFTSLLSPNICLWTWNKSSNVISPWLVSTGIKESAFYLVYPHLPLDTLLPSCWSVVVKEDLNEIVPWHIPGPPFLCFQPWPLKVRGGWWYFSGYLSIYSVNQSTVLKGRIIGPLVPSFYLVPFAMNLAKIHGSL